MAYLIPQTNMDTLQEKINVLNRKAKRLHCTPITLDVIGTRMIEIPDLGITMLHFEIEVAGEAPIINGWSFIATLEHTSDGNIVRAIPGMSHDGELVAYRDAASGCDHCRKNIRRNDTYILRNEKTYKQVGRNCLRDFLGHKSPETMASYAELLALAGDSCGASSEDCGGRIDGIGTLSYLKWVALAIRTYGWVSAKKAQESVEPISKTSQVALMMIDDVKKTNDAPRPEARDLDRAQAALTWIRELPINSDTNDYIYNLSVSCKSDSLPWRQCGLAASLFVAYDMAHNGYEKKERKISEYQGTVGEKITRLLTVKGVVYSPGFRGGTTSIYAMKDEAGNRFTWFSTYDVLSKDQSYVLSGTVKEHEDRFNGLKTTVLTRCKALKTETGAA